MVHGVCWTELTDSSSYGAWRVLDGIDSSSYGAWCVLDGTD